MIFGHRDEPAGPDGSARIRPYLAAPTPVPPAMGSVEAGVEALRPFILTAGRVPGQGYNFEVEAQVSTRTGYADAAGTARLTRELGAIVTMCAEPMSVAEISAALHLHLGVTRVLVGDLHAAGYVDVYSFDVAGSVDSDLILRVMRGLRAIA
jgi:hypothetical protein